MPDQEVIPKGKTQEDLDEARLQYEKVFYELKRLTSKAAAKMWEPRIKKHNKEVEDLFEKKLENAIESSQKEGEPFTHQKYLNLVKSYWKDLYIFDAH